jgi:hypothetical protein
MDTIENEPVGVEGATSSQDTSAEDAQPTETEEIVSDEETVDEGSATLLAGKYNDPKELEKAYLNLQSKLGEIGQKASLVSEIEKETGMTAEQLRQQIAQRNQEQRRQMVEQDPGRAAYQELQQLKQQMALKDEESQLDSYLNSPEGNAYKAHRDKILEVGLYSPSFRAKSYKEIAEELFGATRAQGQKDAYKKIETKIQSQTTGVSKGAPKGKLTLDDLRGLSAEELRSVLPHS